MVALDTPTSSCAAGPRPSCTRRSPPSAVLAVGVALAATVAVAVGGVMARGSVDRMMCALVGMAALAAAGWAPRLWTWAVQTRDALALKRTIAPSARGELVAAIKAEPLPALFEELLAEYEMLQLGTRGRFLWQWLHYGTRLTELPLIAREHYDAVTRAKNLLNLFNTTTDDMGDEEHDVALLRLITRCVSAGELDEAAVARLGALRRRQVLFCWRVFTHIRDAVRTLPRYDEMGDLFLFDVLQMLNEKCYSALMNQNVQLINLTEHRLYCPHTMHAMIFCTLDGMASPAFPMDEFGALRSIYWAANVCANIANSLATYPREIPQRDFSSVLAAFALEHGTLSPHAMRHAPVAQLTDVFARTESVVLRDWLKHRRYMLDTGAERVHSFDVADFVHRNDRFLLMHLSSKGKI